MRTASLFLLLVAALLLLVTGCGGDRVFDVTGVVRGELDDDQVVIQHDDIPGFMPAMTMAFVVRDPAEAGRLRFGDQVTFRFRVGAARSWAEDFRVTGRETIAAMAGGDAAPARPAPARLRAGDAVPAFRLLDEQGRAVTEADWRDRLSLVTFIFTRCPVPEFCPLLAQRFGEIQARVRAEPGLDGRVRLFGVTLDPEFDRPEILQAYGQAVGADPARWSFLTGDPAQIERLTRAFAVYSERNGVTLDHTLTTALIGPDGTVLELWRGNGWRTAEVVTALEQAAGRSDVAARSTAGRDA